MCPIPNGFRYLARNIFLPSLSMTNHNSQLTLTPIHVVQSLAHYSGREGKLRAKFKILRAKSRKPFGIGHMFI
jgi:hypothetical protein